MHITGPTVAADPQYNNVTMVSISQASNLICFQCVANHTLTTTATVTETIPQSNLSAKHLVNIAADTPKYSGYTAQLLQPYACREAVAAFRNLLRACSIAVEVLGATVNADHSLP